MNTKLTLNLEKSVIDRAKEYAKAHNISLSRLIESYLSALVSNKNDDEEITPLVKSLSGVVNLDEDFDHKAAYTEYLIEKYK